MANPEHLDNLKRRAEVWNNWRRTHPDVKPDLRGAELTNFDLGNSDLIDADLSESNLRRAKLANANLAGARLSGADLTGAELPEALFKQLDSLSNAKAISSNAQKLFIAVLAACLYSWLTIASTTDVNLITNRATSSLPIIQTSIPIVGFFYVAPLLLFGAYLYFHFYMQKLWNELGSLPAIFPDGRPIYEKTDPWLLSDLVRMHSRKLKDGTPFLANLQIWASVILTWWVVPLTMLMFWGRYLVRHELLGVILHVLACAVSITAAIFLYRMARNTLSGMENSPLPKPGVSRTWLTPAVTGVSVAVLLAVISAGAIRGVRSGNVVDNYWPNQTGPQSWIPKAMMFLRFSPFADLRTAELSTKPANWASESDKGKLAVKGIQLSASDLRFADMRASFLRSSLLTDADLRQADLLGADLEQAGMIGTNLQGASLASADMRLASIMGAKLDNADIKYAHFEGAQGLTADQLRSADSWCEAFYDSAQLQMLGLPSDNNNQVEKWRLFDEENSSLVSPTTLQAARQADLRRFSVPSLSGTEIQRPSPNSAAGPAGRTSTPAKAYRVPEVAKLYNFPAGMDGTGQTIGIIELGGGYLDSDLDRYFQDLNLKKPNVSWVSVDGHANAPTDANGADPQVEADIEIVGSVAPGANIVVYFSSSDIDGYLKAIQAVLQDEVHHPSVVTIGWGSPESSPSWHTEDLKKIDKLLKTAASRDMTVVVASGDNGARDEATENRLRVDFPASSPWVLAVGGTRLIPGTDSGFSEVVWNDSDSGAGATGGGVSEIFDRPKWQSKIRVPHSLSARPGRGVPDVAINASAEIGYFLVIHGLYMQMGGTSIAAPMWAGLVALLNQGLGRNLGFINPLLYESLGPAGVLRSVTSGHNGIGNLSGYCAGPGWNAATGWGTPDGTKMLQSLQSAKK